MKLKHDRDVLYSLAISLMNKDLVDSLLYEPNEEEITNAPLVRQLDTINTVGSDNESAYGRKNISDERSGNAVRERGITDSEWYRQ